MPCQPSSPFSHDVGRALVREQGDESRAAQGAPLPPLSECDLGEARKASRQQLLAIVDDWSLARNIESVFENEAFNN